jgi:hypothetical protein
MATTTTTYGFNTATPGTEEDTWGGLLNSNFDDIDDILDGTTQVECIRWKRAAMAALALDPDAGNFQTKSISTNSTFTDSFADGDWMVLHLTISSAAVPTWPTGVWVGTDEPTLGNGEHVVGIWKTGSTLYLKYGGEAA